MLQADTTPAAPGRALMLGRKSTQGEIATGEADWAARAMGMISDASGRHDASGARTGADAGKEVDAG
ncbi:hypothetical protein C7E18_23855, partial [Stenotrophomonas maltophilia]